ncbi:MAG: hypothetical protein QM749_15570 [Aquabacterium sp.]
MKKTYLPESIEPGWYQSVPRCLKSKIHMNLNANKPIKKFIFQGDSISFGENEMTDYEAIPMNAENLNWVSEVCKATGVGVNPNYNRISKEHMNQWRALIGKLPINHVLA